MARPILLYTPIFSDTAERITQQLFEYPEKKDIEIWLNTPGGAVSSGWSIVAAINELNRNVNVTVVGDAASFGFIMLLFANNVKAYDTANFMIHRAASWFEDLMNEDELKEIEDRNKIIRTKLEARINEDKFKEITGKSFDDIFDMEDRLDVNLTAKQANEIGLIDEVVTLDVKKRKEIESKYYDEIMALSTPKKVNSNSNNNKMGKLTDLIFGEKDPVLIAQIGETQFAYSKLEEGAKIKAVGKGEHEPITGTFEAEEKTITVVENEITAVKEIDTRGQEIEALKSEIETFKSNQLTAEEVAEVIKQSNDKLNAEIKALQDVIDKAKLTASNPDLPVGEFVDEGVQDDLTIEEKLAKMQREKYESKKKEA